MKSADQQTESKNQRNISPALERWFIEIQKADSRLKRFPDRNGRSNQQHPRAAAMRWVLNFAYLDLDHLSEGDLSNLRYELQCLTRFDMNEPVLLEILVEVGPWPKKDDMVERQQWLQAVMGRIRAHQDLRFVDAETKWVTYYDDQKQRWNTFATMEAIEPGSTELSKLIREHINDLLVCKCEDCEHPLFLRDRRNQDYCSHRCKWRHAQRNRPDRTIPPERFGKRGRPPGTVANKGKTDGQKKTKKATTTRRAHPRRVSAKKP